MKRSLIFVVCAVFLFLSSCGFTARRKSVTEHFSCNFTATYDELQLGGTVQRGESGTLTLSLSKPASLSGLVCRLDGEDITLRLGDLEYKTEVIPAAAVPRLLCSVLDAMYDVSPHSSEEHELTYSGAVGTLAFTALADAESGFIQSVSVPNANFEIQFTEVEKIKE